MKETGEGKSGTSKLEFTPERMDRFRKLVAKYEIPDCALLPTLWLAQEQWGYLTDESMTYVASLLGMPPRAVFEAVTFYFMYKKKDMGKYCLQICNNITCNMMGADTLLSVARDELGLGPNEVGADKMFSVVPVQCLGSCDTGPVVQVNDDYVENLTPESFRQLLKKLKGGEKVLPSEVVTQP